MGQNMKIIYTIFYIIISTVSCSVFSAPPTWYMVNVNYHKNQGDAHILLTGGAVTLIDAGYRTEAERQLIPKLRQLGIKRIDHFFVSHPHRDHYEGIRSILRAGIKVTNAYYNLPKQTVHDCCYLPNDFANYLRDLRRSGTVLHEVSEDFKLTYPDKSTMEILVAYKGVDVDVNDLSLIMRWSVLGTRVLFTGDLNHTLGQRLSTDERMRANILKVPHHGGYGIAPRPFFELVNPQINMVPAPAWIWQGERGKIAREFTVDNGVKHCVNGINGTVNLRFYDGYVNIASDRPNSNCPNTSIKMERILDGFNIAPILVPLLLS